MKKTLSLSILGLFSLIAVSQGETPKSTKATTSKPIGANATSISGQRAPKILTLDFKEVYTNYYKAQESEKKFEDIVNAKNEEVKNQLDENIAFAQELQKLNDKLGNPSTSLEAKQEIEEQLRSQSAELQKRQADWQRLCQEAEMQLTQRQQKIIETHSSEIREVVANLAREQKVDIVLNASAGIGVIYAEPSFDITAEVISLLNARSPEGKIKSQL
jgi:Skp family chaperone for outer membrane proteins